MISKLKCDRSLLVNFLGNQLDLDDKLDFLDHVRECKKCCGEIYAARKNEHPHYYKANKRQVKVSQKELDHLTGVPRPENNEEEQVLA